MTRAIALQSMKDKLSEKREKLEEFSAVMRQLIDMEREIREAIKNWQRITLYAIGNQVQIYGKVPG